MNGILSELEDNPEYEELIIELERSEEALFSKLSRNHKRTIKNSIEMDQNIIQVSSLTPEVELNFYFNKYRDLHILVSGRETRPIESFEFMKTLIRTDTSKLFVSISQGEPISFLYCDSNREYARGWSQVTKPNLGKKIFPRTLLEWTAIQAYKAEGRSVYHLGTHEKKSSDLISESLGFQEFKRRFGPTIIK
jgi:lipid II:glycine glycyltransferase (peptidoglycan interpeptide bridge formation enzyme)